MGKQFKLRATLHGHEKDVRGLCPALFPFGAIVSGSRDVTAKIWAPNEMDLGFREAHVMSGHGNFVNCVAVMPATEEYAQGLILTGSTDHTIKAYTLESPAPVYTLSGHSSTVCALACGNHGTLLSGSWDKTAKVWLKQKCAMTLAGHEAAVWAVLMVPEEGLMITASADKTIKVWKMGKCLRTLTGHTDCVRALVLTSAKEFISCANDATIRKWTTAGDCLQIYEGHTNYIYSVAALPDTGMFFSCGEDRSLRVWDEIGECEQSITLPAQSLWSVCCLANGDVAVGCSDGTIRVFTAAEERMATAEEVAALEDEVSKSAIPEQIGDLKTQQIPGPEALLQEGSREGQTKMVKRGDLVECHQWSAADSRWVKVGEVVGASGSTQDTSGKTLYEGEEYDYVFDVSLTEGESLKLPYNAGQDPWMVAQKFIHKHDLSQLFLDQIANFIRDQVKDVTLGATDTYENSDPFTGDCAYRPGEASDDMPRQGGGSGLASDPLTGDGRYIPGTADDIPGPQPMQVDAPRSEFFPVAQAIQFGQGKVNAILGKLQEFRLKQSVAGSDLTEKQVEALESFADGFDHDGEAFACVTTVLSSWNPEYLFPLLDVLRLGLKFPLIGDKVCADEGIVNHLIRLLATKDVPANQLMAGRCLANLCCHDKGGKTMLQKHKEVLESVVTARESSPPRGHQVALATLLLNLSVLAVASTAQEVARDCIQAACALFPVVSEAEALFRLLCAMGTLVASLPSARLAAGGLELEGKMRGVAASRDNVNRCKEDVLRALV